MACFFSVELVHKGAEGLLYFCPLNKVGPSGSADGFFESTRVLQIGLIVSRENIPDLFLNNSVFLVCLIQV